MSAILSADDLNDFISPGVACIKPVETLPRQQPASDTNPYEVTTEDKVAPADGAPPAQISLTDCLACSGCVTSAEAVLVSLQSHEEVLSTLSAHPSLSIDDAANCQAESNGRVFVASVSPQARASLAALYEISEEKAGYLIEQLLTGPHGVRDGGQYSSGFTWVLDTNRMRDVGLAASVEEIIRQSSGSPKTPVLSSACPGWICYAEKTHPHVLPHLSRLKSPQALTGTLLKSILWRRFGVPPSRVWHLAIMPCFDKKLEASREELTDVHWMADSSKQEGVRDVDCVVTARELLMLAESRGISFPSLPKAHVNMPPFPDAMINSMFFAHDQSSLSRQRLVAGPSGGYAYYVLKQLQTQVPHSTIRVERGRNPDVVDYLLEVDGKVVSKTARYFGFRNIQNLVRKLKPAKHSRLPGARQKILGSSRTDQSMTEYAYIEVMACPGGCTNGGGQVKVEDLPSTKSADGEAKKATPAEQKQWLARVDEAYYSADSSDDEYEKRDAMAIDARPTSTVANGHATLQSGQSDKAVQPFLTHWSDATGVELERLLFTSFRKVESDVGKKQGATSDMDRVAGLASSIGGGW